MTFSTEFQTNSKKVGYAYLKDKLHLGVFDPKITAELNPSVNSFVRKDALLLVPTRYQLPPEDLVGHILFALKHEGINLQILSEALRHISEDAIVSAIADKLSGIYQRKLAYLWEFFNRKELSLRVPSSVRYVKLFDEERYVTVEGIKNTKWRVIFNGLGNLNYCPIVEKTEKIQSALADNVLDRVKDYLSEIGESNADRALQWAYLSETESSYAIEGEKTDTTKAERFVSLLQHAHEDVELTEEYLCNLQNQVITNPFDMAFTYRNEQNWLSSGGRGALGVSYVPPSPECLEELMQAFLKMANSLPKQISPVIAASVTSFGFVFLHPFMDGNGRLSRFLFHQQLCSSGQLQKGQLLPVSVAMKSSESQYLSALQDFSKPSRALWSVTWIADGDFDFRFKGSDAIYRYWDATSCAEFGLQMAEDALNIHLRQEVNYLTCFDEIHRAVSDRYDVRETILHHLINGCLDLNGVVSKNLRKRYAERVEETLFDYIEAVAKKALKAHQC